MSTESRSFYNVISTRPGFWVSGFLLLGTLLGPLGALLIAWNYYIDADPRIIGLHFLALNTGYIVASLASQKLVLRIPLPSLALSSCTLGCIALLSLSLLSPPLGAVWRIGTLALLGISAGSLATTLLHALEEPYADSPIQTLNKSGLMFGIGCLLATVVTGALYSTHWLPNTTALLALIPFAYLLRYARTKSSIPPRPAPQSSTEVRAIAVFLLTLLLFFQFGNEWAIAGWLPLFLIHTLGSNPGSAIFALALYFLVLILGRFLGQRVMGTASPRRLLIASLAVAISGYLLLALTQSLADAYVGFILAGLGFGPIYPLLMEHLDARFSYRPGFYNRLLSVAVTGAMCTPWILGYVDAWLGMRFVMLVPAFGSIAVLILALLIVFEARLMSEKPVAV